MGDNFWKYYRKHLKSEHWRKLKLSVMGAADFKCQCCGERAETVHHCSYDAATMSGKRRRNLIAICHRCHRRGHRWRDGSKRRLSEANAAIRGMVKARAND